jgi:hypothetical protein
MDDENGRYLKVKGKAISSGLWDSKSKLTSKCISVWRTYEKFGLTQVGYFSFSFPFQFLYIPCNFFLKNNEAAQVFLHLILRKWDLYAKVRSLQGESFNRQV